jgi:hypothetical protein
MNIKEAIEEVKRLRLEEGDCLIDEIERLRAENERLRTLIAEEPRKDHPLAAAVREALK